MSETNAQIMERINQVVTVIPKRYIDALLVLNEKIPKEIKWIINGSLAENLKVVPIEPENIEIVTSKEGAHSIFAKLAEYAPQPISFRTERLPRDAEVEGKAYHIYVRGYFFDFVLKDIPVRVLGDLQFKVGEWDWGDVFDFEPDYVYVVGKKIAVTPLPIAYQLYQCLGWTDRMEKIQIRLEKQMRHLR